MALRKWHIIVRFLPILSYYDPEERKCINY